MEFINYFKQEWATIRKAPFLVIIILIFGFILGKIYSHDLVTTSNKQVELFKDRLQVNSPNEALKKYEELKNELTEAKNKLEKFKAQTEPRHINENQKEEIVNLLKQHSNTVICLYANENIESIKYSKQWGEALAKAGWNVKCEGTVVFTFEGIYIRIKNDSDIALAKTLQSAFRIMNEEAKIEFDEPSENSQIELAVGSK